VESEVSTELSTNPRDVGLLLLQESRSYEIAVAPSGTVDIAVRGSVVRTRRLIRGAFLLPDEELDIEAMVLVRSALDTG
jgi:hypothetical protein